MIPPFDGHTYNHKRDHLRLAKQYRRVFHAMSDSQWRTLREIFLHDGRFGSLHLRQDSRHAKATVRGK